MRAGSVPIVLGAPNIDQFDPLYNTTLYTGPAYLRISSIVNLALEIKKLMENKDEYEKYLDWKRLGLGEHFKSLITNRYSHEGPCTMCKAVAYIKMKK